MWIKKVITVKFVFMPSNSWLNNFSIINELIQNFLFCCKSSLNTEGHILSDMILIYWYSELWSRLSFIPCFKVGNSETSSSGAPLRWERNKNNWIPSKQIVKPDGKLPRTGPGCVWCRLWIGKHGRLHK